MIKAYKGTKIILLIHDTDYILPVDDDETAMDMLYFQTIGRTPWGIQNVAI